MDRENHNSAAKEDWWRSFFSGVSVDLWLAAASDDHTHPEVDFLEKMLNPSTGDCLLDVACGGGRHAIELAARGYRLTGVDISEDFLKIAREQATERKQSILWQQGEMQDLRWEGEFDGAYCFGNSFGYLSDDLNARFLAGVARALKPGAKFAIDSGALAESILPNLEKRRWFEIGGILFLIDNEYDHRTGRLETEYTFIRDGKTEKRRGSQRIYTFSELCRLLRDAGFDGIEGFSSLDGEPFRVGSQRLLLAATKRAG